MEFIKNCIPNLTCYPNLLIKNLNTVPIILFLLSNLAYLPSVIKSNTYELYILLVVFIVSTVYHIMQVIYRSNDTKKAGHICASCMYMDMIVATIGAIIIFGKYYKNINSTIIILVIISGIIFASHFTKKFGHGYWYLYLHTIWHLLTGLIAYLLISDNDQKNIKKK